MSLPTSLRDVTSLKSHQNFKHTESCACLMGNGDCCKYAACIRILTVDSFGGKGIFPSLREYFVCLLKTCCLVSCWPSGLCNPPRRGARRGAEDAIFARYPGLLLGYLIGTPDQI